MLADPTVQNMVRAWGQAAVVVMISFFFLCALSAAVLITFNRWQARDGKVILGESGKEDPDTLANIQLIDDVLGRAS